VLGLDGPPPLLPPHAPSTSAAMMAKTDLFIRPPPQAARGCSPLIHRLLSGTMSRGRLALLVLAAGALGSQAGHVLAYELRFGDAAGQLQSAGVHSYFPAAAKTGLGLASLALLAGLLVVGMARVVSSKPVARSSAPSFVRLLAAVYTLRLAIFAVQETAEAAFGGVPAGSAPLLLMWGAVGQLPVAIAASLAVRWLLVRVRPALALLRLAPVYRWIVRTVALSSWPPPARLALSAQALDHHYRRGPPSF